MKEVRETFAGDAPSASLSEESSNISSARELMNSGAPWVDYVNEVVFREEKQAGISIDANYKIDAGTHSVLELLNLFKNSGWSWPRGWHRRNLNPAHRGGIHLEKEVENGRWIHLIIVPQSLEQTSESPSPPTDAFAEDWNLPPLRVDLHTENRWLRPSSTAHFRDYIKERYLLPFLKMVRLR